MTQKNKKQSAWLAVFALGVLTWTGCGGETREALAESMMKSMDEMADVLVSVKDEASAKAAVGKLEAISATMKSLTDKIKALGDAPADVQSKLDEKMKAKQAEIQKKMNTFMQNVMSNPSLMEIIAPAMQKMGESIEK